MPLYHVNYSFNSSSSNDTAGHVFETPALSQFKSVNQYISIQIIVPKLLHFHMQKHIKFVQK